MGNSQSTQPTPSQPPQSKKEELRPCCACPDTRKLRDECVLLNGEEKCKKEIDDHKLCLKKLGFD